MAVEAVVSVVIQKLADMLIEEPVVFDKVIDQVKEIRIKLRRMRGFLIDAEENQEHNEAVEKWADNYLRILYDVEDYIEAFALRIASHRWRRPRRSNNTTRLIGDFCNNLAALFFFFNDLKACQKLRGKLADIGIKIDRLNKAKPGIVRDASFKYLFRDSSLQENNCGHNNNNIEHHEYQAEEEEEEEGEEGEISAMDIERVCRGKTDAEPVKTPRSGGSSFGEHLRQRTLTSSFPFEEEESGLVGFEERVNALVKRLTSDSDSDEESSSNNIISIVGEVGSGKTTLAQAIYKSKEIKNHFQGRAWVFVSKDYTERDVLLFLLKQVESSNSKDQDQGVVLNPEQLLVNRLSEKKYLVVMDDVRTPDVWDKLKDAFPSRRNGSSKIILITCDEQVALSAAADRHPMKGLSKDESWKMFLKKARLSETSKTSAESDPDISDLKKKILKICKGLPLKIVLLGGLLSTKKVNKDEWSRVLDHIYEDGDGLDILISFCYNDLPAHSKLCLLYLALFPKEFDIPVRRLVRLWLAEGFVKRSPTTAPEEDVAGEYFDDLLNRNLIQISKFRSDGRSPRRCRLPNALHDYLLPKTQDISLFHVHRSNSDCNMEEIGGRFGLRRIVEYLNINYCNLKDSELQYLRSYISFNVQRKDIPARQVTNFVSKITGNRGFGLLRVLDLERVYKPSLPDELGDLFHLRYLGLRWTFLDNLPASVSNLPHLKTLDLKRTYINSLPNSIWKLEHLRHLNLNEIRLDMPEQQNSPLPRLLTLWGLFVDDKSSIKNGLSKLHDLRELGITFNLTSCSELADWISNLTNLQNLRLRSKDGRGRPSKLDLKPLSKLGKLSHMKLQGNLQKLPDKHAFPPGLKVLTLSVSCLNDDPMPTLGQLQSLTVLRLLANSYLGKKIVCPLRGFSKLRVLKLWMLKDLEEWDVKEGAMQNLKEINIRCCGKLKTLPPSLLQLSSLEELILTNMPETFVTEVRERKSDHTSLTENNWDFTPLPWEEEEEEENDSHINGTAPLVNGQHGHSETTSSQAS